MTNEIPEEISFSNGWLEKFKIRYKIGSKRICGEAGSIDPKIIEEERLKLQNILKEYDLDDIINGDETGLYYELQPNYTLEMEKESATGGKNQNDG